MLLLVRERVARGGIHGLIEGHLLRILICRLEIANHVVIAARSARLEPPTLTVLVLSLSVLVLREVVVHCHTALLCRLIFVNFRSVSGNMASLLLILSKLGGDRGELVGRAGVVDMDSLLFSLVEHLRFPILVLLLVAKLWQSLAKVRRHAVGAAKHERRCRVPEWLLTGGAHGRTIGLHREARVGRCLHEWLRRVHAGIHGRHRSHVRRVGRLGHHDTRMVRHWHGLGAVGTAWVAHARLSRVGTGIVRVQPSVRRAGSLSLLAIAAVSLLILHML